MTGLACFSAIFGWFLSVQLVLRLIQLVLFLIILGNILHVISIWAVFWVSELLDASFSFFFNL